MSSTISILSTKILLPHQKQENLEDRVSIVNLQQNDKNILLNAENYNLINKYSNANYMPPGDLKQNKCKRKKRLLSCFCI